MIKYFNSQECKPLLEQVFRLAQKKFRGDLIFDVDERTLARWHSPHMLVSAAYDTEKDEILSYFTWTITDTDYRDGLLEGRYEENDLYVYCESAPPVLLFNTFVVTNSFHAPHIIHRLTKDLHRLIQADNLRIVGGLSIGGLRLTEKWLKKYGFHEIGRYKGKYPILWATRQESGVLNSLCTVGKHH